MKKFIAITALTALATIGTATQASAYSINDAGAGFVGKGEVKTALSFSDTQVVAGPLAFTQKTTETTTVTWSCTRVQVTGNGTVHVDTRPKENVTTTTWTTPVNHALRFNNNGTLNGVNLTTFGEATTPVTTVTGPVVDSCNKNPEGFVHDGNTVTTDTVTKDLFVNDVLIPAVVPTA